MEVTLFTFYLQLLLNTDMSLIDVTKATEEQGGVTTMLGKH